MTSESCDLLFGVSSQKATKVVYFTPRRLGIAWSEGLEPEGLDTWVEPEPDHYLGQSNEGYKHGPSSVVPRHL